MTELSPQTQDGFLEYLLNSYVKHNKTFLYYQVENFEIIDNFVPNDFFIQNYSSRKTDTLKTFVENKNRIKINKKSLPKKNIYFQQRQFIGKYYDCAILIYEKQSNYKILLLQVSKKKIAQQKFYRDEHQIIFNRVKNKIEKEYDVVIIEGHFSYILNEEEQDQDTIEFCHFL